MWKVCASTSFWGKCAGSVIQPRAWRRKTLAFLTFSVLFYLWLKWTLLTTFVYRYMPSVLRGGQYSVVMYYYFVRLCNIHSEHTWWIFYSTNHVIPITHALQSIWQLSKCVIQRGSILHTFYFGRKIRVDNILSKNWNKSTGNWHQIEKPPRN